MTQQQQLQTLANYVRLGTDDSWKESQTTIFVITNIADASAMYEEVKAAYDQAKNAPVDPRTLERHRAIMELLQAKVSHLQQQAMKAPPPSTSFLGLAGVNVVSAAPVATNNTATMALVESQQSCNMSFCIQKWFASLSWYWYALFGVLVVLIIVAIVMKIKSKPKYGTNSPRRMYAQYSEDLSL